MLLGARQFFEKRGKSAPTARDYVQDGLIAMWDGIENAGWGVHDAAATTWKDLVGDYDLAISQGAQFDSTCFRTNGVAKAAYSTTAYFLKDVTYYEAVFKMLTIADRTTNPYVSLVVARQRNGTHSTQKNVIIANENPASYMPPNFCFNKRTAVRADTLDHSACCGFIDSSVNFLMLDGSEISVDTYPLYQGVFSDGISVGSSTNSSYVCDGRLYSFRVYSRAPTAAEIAANYAIDKERFNLP